MTPGDGSSLAAALAAGTLLWLVSLWRRDASIADVAWGPLFVVIAGTSFALGGGSGARRILALGLVSLWALRLAAHLGRRNGAHGEDTRYRAWRERYGSRFWLVSLPLVFVLQPLLAWLVAAPLRAVMDGPGPTQLTGVDLVAAAIFAVGLGCEWLADRQLSAFREEPENRGRVLDRGLFRYSRHPNYFGEFVLWWGLGILGLAAGSVASLLGPALLTLLLLRVSGVALLESTIASRRPGYSQYKATTNAFFPGPPRRAS